MHGRVTLDAKHVYRHADGRPIPGVTTLLSAVLGDQWAGRATQYHMDRGNAAHALYAILGRGEDLATYDIDPALDGYARQWRAWYATVGPHIEVVERLVYSPRHDYAGTLDALAVIGSQLTIIDYKQSATTRDVWQMGLYAAAWTEETGIKIKQAVGVEITADGWRMSEPVRGAAWERATREGLAARTVWGMMEAEGTVTRNKPYEPAKGEGA